MSNKISLESFATPIASKGTFIKASFGGFAGSGKTRTATEFIIGVYKKLGLTKPVLILDNEKGGRFLEKKFADAGIKALVKETVHLADVHEAFKFVASGEVDFLFMDSLTKIWYQYVRDYRSKNRKSFMTLQDWGKILPSWQEEFADKFVDLVGNVVFTGRGGYQYDMEENEETGKKEFAKSGVKMKLAGETPFEPDLNIWMQQEQELKDGVPVIWRTAQIMKDRSDTIDGKIFKNPTFADFEPAINFLLSVPVGAVAGATNSKNLAPGDNYDSENRKRQREIYLEEIKACFTELGLGKNADGKALTIRILDHVFKTKSWTAVEGLSIESLQSGSVILKEFTRQHKSVEVTGPEDSMNLLVKAIKDVSEFGG